MKGVFTITTERRFADELARVVLADHGGDPLSLADVLILLPTRRSGTSTTANGRSPRARAMRSLCRPPSSQPSVMRS